jgi:hypothetical protein
MLEAAGTLLFEEEADKITKVGETPTLHQAPAIKDASPTPHVLLAESPIPALGRW